MAAELALDLILASFFHCRLTIELLNINEPTEKFNAIILHHAENPWPYMAITHPWPDDMNFRLLDSRGTCILHIFLTTNGKISQAAPGMDWWAALIMDRTYYLSIRVVQNDTPLSPWSREFRGAEFVQHTLVLENWVLITVTLSSNHDYIVEEISAMYFYCSREDIICLKNLLLSTPHDKLFSQMFPLSWPTGFFDYRQWPMFFVTNDDWIRKGESKVETLLNPPPFRLLLPKALHTSHIFENRELSDLLLYFNASLEVIWSFGGFIPLTFVRMEILVEQRGGYSLVQSTPQLGFVYCMNKTSPHHYIDSIASPLDWPTWACAGGTYVAICVTVRMISGQWQLLNLFISVLAQGATVCLKKLRAVWLLWVITAIFLGWFFTSSIEALLVSPTLPTGINDMVGLFNNGYTLVMDGWSDEGQLVAGSPEFMSETAYLRDLKGSLELSWTYNSYDETFLKDGLNTRKRALVLEPEHVNALLIELQEEFVGKQCFGNPNALSLYPVAMMTEIVNGRMVRDAAIRLKEAGLGVWYARKAAISRAYEWALKFRKILKAAFPDQVKESGAVKENAKDTLLEGFHRTTDGTELTALLVVCSTALAVAFAIFVTEVLLEEILVVAAKISALWKSFWRLAFGFFIWIECVVGGYIAMAAQMLMRFVRY